MFVENKEWLEKFCKESKIKRNQSKYDILVPISGGKDGSYLLWYLSTNTDLRILAFHIDNWYVTGTARKNVENICRDLGCDLEIVRPSWKRIKDFYQQLMMINGEICMACEMMISLYPIDCAVSYHIPYIAWGLTPMQIKGKKINSGYLSIDFAYYDKIAKYYDEVFSAVYKDNEAKYLDMKETLLTNPATIETLQYPTFVMPFYWLGYDATEVEQTVKKEVDWVRSMDAGGTSSNCLINKLHIYLKKQIKGDEFYQRMMDNKEDANEVDARIKEKALNEAEDHELYSKILKELGIECSEEDLINHIKNTKKDIIFKLGSNISQ
jgi:hypothetical protein